MTDIEGALRPLRELLGLQGRQAQTLLELVDSDKMANALVVLAQAFPQAEGPNGHLARQARLLVDSRLWPKFTTWDDLQLGKELAWLAREAPADDEAQARCPLLRLIGLTAEEEDHLLSLATQAGGFGAMLSLVFDQAPEAGTPEEATWLQAMAVELKRDELYRLLWPSQRALVEQIAAGEVVVATGKEPAPETNLVEALLGDGVTVTVMIDGQPVAVPFMDVFAAIQRLLG